MLSKTRFAAPLDPYYRCSYNENSLTISPPSYSPFFCVEYDLVPSLRATLSMADETLGDPANINAGDGEDGQGVANAFNALKLSSPPSLASKSSYSPQTKTGEMDDHARDSGYGSATSSPDLTNKVVPLRKAGQIPFIRQLGLCISNKAMEPSVKRRFLEVHLELERMLLEFMRKLKSMPGRYKPIAIRPMMLGKTEADTDANAYMVVICSENIKRKVQDFFDEPLVKSLCEPNDDDIPSFKALVIGHAIRLRASKSDIKVQCDAANRSYDGTKTFCGTPIRLCDELGHSRNATFGGMVKVTFSEGNYGLYGLTAGHLIRDHQVMTDDDDASLVDLNGNDLVDFDLREEVVDAPADQIRTTSPELANDIDRDDPDNWSFRNEHHLGYVLDEHCVEALVNGEQSQMKLSLDWALFELNAHRPNQLAYNGRDHSRGDLHLPSLVLNPRKDEVPVSMLCASQGVKRGVLSTTRARVLLDPGEDFTDAYILSLEGSNGK